MAIILRLIAASLFAGSACAAATSSAGITLATASGEGSVGARTTSAASPVGERRNAESEIDVVSKLFLGSIDRRHVRLANAAYPWMTVGNVYFVYDWNRVLVVAAAGDGKPPISLTGNSKAVAEFVSRQSGGRFLGVRATARLLTDVTVGPGAALGTSDLLLDPEDLREWMRGREKDPAVFRSFCGGIKGQQRENEWELQFNVFNQKGGVDAVTASGTTSPFTIRQLNVTPVKPAGEFRFPFAG